MTTPPSVLSDRVAAMFEQDPACRDLYVRVRDHAYMLIRTGHDPALVAMALASLCSFILAVTATEHER